MPLGKPIVGRDVSVLLVQGQGLESGDPTLNPDTAYEFIGKWRTIRLEVSGNWAAVTSSDANWEERRRTTRDWRATLDGIMRINSNTLMGIMDDSDIVLVNFTVGDKQCSIIGGIERASIEVGKESGYDTMEIINIGLNQLSNLSWLENA
jgi:hypothetical protein